MKKKSPISPDLIAPCGMNCAVCSRYLSHVNNLKRSRCIGCRPRNTSCSYLFGKCAGINHASKCGNAAYCFTCARYPCKQINRIDRRYRTSYGMSMKENLEYIMEKGIGRFLNTQYKKYRCPKCDGFISTHNGKCFRCDTVTKLMEKRTTMLSMPPGKVRA